MKDYLSNKNHNNNQLIHSFILVYYRVRPVDYSNPKTVFPSNSAIVYWQIESREDILFGTYL